MADENENPTLPTNSTTEQAPPSSSSMAENEAPETSEQAPPSSSMVENETPETSSQAPPQENPTEQEAPQEPTNLPLMAENENPITIMKTESPSLYHHLYNVNFFGTDITVTLTCSPTVASEWVSELKRMRWSRNHYNSHRLVVGFGVQWVPGEHSPAAVIQICAGKRCLIFQLGRADSVPDVVRSLFISPSVKLVGFQSESYAERLMRSVHAVEVMDSQLVDLRYHVDGGRLVGASFKKIVKECLGFEGVRLKNSINCSNWEAQFLSFDQVRQASVEAYVCLLIGLNIEAWKI